MNDQDYSKMVKDLVKNPQEILDSLDLTKVGAFHMALGIGGEAGEVVDVIKKHIANNIPLDRQKLVKELGDLEFYLEGVRQIYGITREEVLEKNYEKLDVRYEGEYSDEKALRRADVLPIEAPIVLETIWLPNFGRQPVEDGITVEVMLRCGLEGVGPSQDWFWGLSPEGFGYGEIIAWRLVK